MAQDLRQLPPSGGKGRCSSSRCENDLWPRQQRWRDWAPRGDRRTDARSAAATLRLTRRRRPSPKPAADNMTLTAVEGIKVGSVTLTERPTGCTVDPRQGRHDRQRGRARRRAGHARNGSAEPGEQRADRQRDRRSSGGSAFGLDAASGVMKWLDEQNIGYPVGAAGVVPIVPAAILFDLGFGGNPKIRPGADCGYKAARLASEAPVQEGNVGAGAGATVGKSGGVAASGDGGPMKAGIGSAAIKMPNGLVVAAIVAVNAVGDIIDPVDGPGRRGRARRRTASWSTRASCCAAAADARGAPARTRRSASSPPTRRLTKVQAQKMAQMAHDGYARAISPVHTPGDGDTIFSLATGTWDGDGELRPDRIARGRSDGRRDRPRRHAGHRRRTDCPARAIWGRCRRGSGSRPASQLAVRGSQLRFAVRSSQFGSTDETTRLPATRRRAALPATSWLPPSGGRFGQAPGIITAPGAQPAMPVRRHRR